jgi:alpha-1,6-mannosyltransferase
LVLAACDALARDLREIGIARVQRHTIGVDCTLFHPCRRDVALRAELGIARDAYMLLYAGPFGAEQNLSLIADAARRLGPRWVFVALGAGPAAPRGRQVIVLPPARDAAALARALACADAFVHAGEEETFGLSALEAMACGTPVVVRAAGALPELVDRGAGIAVASGRVGEWAEALAALVAVPRGRWSRAARARALDHDWSVVLPALLRRYQRLLDDGAPATSVPQRPGFGEATQPTVLWHAPAGVAAQGHHRVTPVGSASAERRAGAS